MDYAFEIIIALLVLAGYGAIRLVIDVLLTVDKLVTKLANYAKTVEKQPFSTPVQANKVLTSIATKVDKRHKYTVNVEACERYLASRQK